MVSSRGIGIRKTSNDFQKVENYQKIAESFFVFDEVQKDSFRPQVLKNSRQGHHSAAYGGLIFSQALAAAEKTVDSVFRPHSVHSYFILNVDTKEPIFYNVRRIRDGRSFATRTVEAVQKEKIAFTLQVSFHVEENEAVSHQSNMPDVLPPEQFMSMREAVPHLKELVEKGEIVPTEPVVRRLKKYDSQVYTAEEDLFEMRCVNLEKYYGLDDDREPRMHFWMRARGDLNDDEKLHRWLVAYNTDSTLISTAVGPHYAKNFMSSMMFSLDHCVWFHRINIRADEWLLFETKSHIAAGGRAFIDGKVWRRDGTLMISVHQEALIRSKGDTSRL
ncbi:unnamed protein product [Caenorhabditis bovis]|uniref:Acyl-CoA thioesterase II n=1 Tax=Caenorhabditis bovis TaxID=2654633 RepID=A0A8S1FFC9_9PELO|nr:unnamed protein product [Caenorhabditis bovis]